MERVVKYIRIKCTSARILYDYEITIWNRCLTIDYKLFLNVFTSRIKALYI
jgi:hypothetical protein